eukprot:1040127-Amphidinium_carterae.5
MAELREALLQLYNKERHGGYNLDALLTVLARLATRPWLDPLLLPLMRISDSCKRGLFARLWEALSHFNWRASSLHVWYTAEGTELQMRTVVPGSPSWSEACGLSSVELAQWLRRNCAAPTTGAR